MRIKVPKEKALTLLRKQIAGANDVRVKTRTSVEFQEWNRETHAVVENLFGHDSPETEKLKNIRFGLRTTHAGTSDVQVQKAHQSGVLKTQAQLKAFVSQIENFWSDEESSEKHKGKAEVLRVLSRFHSVVRQLKSRHAQRNALLIKDEYDVQDLLHALLKIYFDDIRREEWTPSNAGASTRMDILLQEAKIVVECKMSRSGTTDKPVGEELIIDIAKYRTHPSVNMLICFVYDPAGILKNGCGLEADLSRTIDGLDVVCYITPK